MKKNNIYIPILSIILTLGLLSACQKDILDKAPLDQYSPETFYSNEGEVRMGLIGVYNSIIPNNHSIHWYQFDFMSDDLAGMDWTGSLEFGAWLHNSSSITAHTKWAHAYRGIGRANKFIESMESSPISQDLKTLMSAEARFIRAYYYADLIHFYGDVPLFLKSPTLEEATVERTPKSTVLEAIIADFDFATTNLPLRHERSDIGRATKGAALAYKARTLLYNERWEEAAVAAKAVMDLGVYDLFPDYEGLFLEDNENNIEVIFDIQYIKDLHPQTWPTSALVFSVWPCGSISKSLIDSYRMTNGMRIDEPGSGYDDQNPFVNRDPRMAATIVLPGEEFEPGEILIPDNMEKVQGATGAKARKYADLGNSDKDNCSINTILMRYADILLMRAEALIESGSTGQEVYDLINQVRQRPSVNMPIVEDAEGTGLGKEELRRIVRNERRVELPVEGLRYQDMLRYKDESLVHDLRGYNMNKLIDPSNPEEWVFEEVFVDPREFDPKKGWLWPVPQVELQNNSKLTQNDGF